MTPIRSLTAAAVVLVTAALTGCGSTAPGQVAAQDACKTYASTTRGQVPEMPALPSSWWTTAAGVEAVRARAQSDALRATSADSRWQTLQNDIQDAYGLVRMGAATDNEKLTAYFAADRRVQADCKAADQDIGDLLP